MRGVWPRERVLWPRERVLWPRERVLMKSHRGIAVTVLVLIAAAGRVAASKGDPGRSGLAVPPNGTHAHVRLDAMTPWLATIAGVHPLDLDRLFADLSADHLAIESSDEADVAAVLRLLRSIQFEATPRKTDDFDFRYRISLITVSDGKSWTFYATPFGDVAQNSKAMTFNGNENWLYRLWILMLGDDKMSYAPFNKPQR